MYKLNEQQTKFLDETIPNKVQNLFNDEIVDNFSVALPFSYQVEDSNTEKSGFQPYLGGVAKLFDDDDKPKYVYYTEGYPNTRHMLLSYKYDPILLEHYWEISLETFEMAVEDVEIIHDTITYTEAEDKRLIFHQRVDAEKGAVPQHLSETCIKFWEDVDRIMFMYTKPSAELLTMSDDDEDEDEL